MDYSDLLKKAIDYRSTLFEIDDLNVFRIFNGIADGIDGISIDLYNEYILIQYFKNNVDLNKIVKVLENVISSIPFDIKGILLKNRIKVSGVAEFDVLRESKLAVGSLPSSNYHVKQNGVLASVDLINGQNTGLFLDMREVRDELSDYYGAFSSFVNFFCYTAMFSVNAIKNGVGNSLNVDLSRTVLKRAKENYILNDINVDDRDFIYGDSGDWINRFHKKKRDFDLVFYDPPTFSRNKKGNFSVTKDYAPSLMNIAKIAPKGYVLTSINSYSVSEEEYFSYHPASWKNEFYLNESFDFKIDKKPYLKVGLWKVL